MSSPVSLAPADRLDQTRSDAFPRKLEEDPRESIDELTARIFSCNDLMEIIFSKVCVPTHQHPINFSDFKGATAVLKCARIIAEKALKNNIEEILIFIQDQDRDVDSYVRECLKLDQEIRLGCGHYVECCNKFYDGLLKKWDLGFKDLDTTYYPSEIRAKVIRYSEYEFCFAAQTCLREYSDADDLNPARIPKPEVFMKDPNSLKNWIETNKSRVVGLKVLDFKFPMFCIPKEISAFRGLEEIHLIFTATSLASLPPEILGLPNLKKITESAGLNLRLTETFKNSDTCKTLLTRGLLERLSR